MMCELLSVSRSGLNAARGRAPSKRAVQDKQVLEQIRHGHRLHRGRYGRRRMTPEVSQALGQVVNHKRVARLMREHGLQSHKRRRFRVVTTDSKHAHPVAPNVLARDFQATAPNQKWLADMTYVATDEGWLYVALVLDLHARLPGGLGNERDDGPGADAASAGRGTGLARSPGGTGTPLGPRIAVRGQGLPQQAQGARHHGVHEPQGGLLGQRADGIGQRHLEG